MGAAPRRRKSTLTPVLRQVDVMVIQSRLTTLINDGLLPGLAPLTVDGQCGSKTKDAIGEQKGTEGIKHTQFPPSPFC